LPSRRLRRAPWVSQAPRRRAYGEDAWVKGASLARRTCDAVKAIRGPANTKISSEGRHRECPDLVCCILLFYGLSFVQPRMNYVVEGRRIRLRQVCNDAEAGAVKLRRPDLFKILRHRARFYRDGA
jgi:hypothetical protein